jgi:hypothetical protein
MLNWNDADLARIRHDEFVREAENDRLTAPLRARSRRVDLARPLAFVRAQAPRLVPLAIAFGVLAAALR